MDSSLQRRFAPVLYVLIFFAGFFSACLWFNPQDYLADLPPTLTAVAAFALVWLAYAAFSARAERQRGLLYRQSLMQKESVHPVLHAEIKRAEDRPEMLVLAVRNYGKGMAEKVKMRIEAVSDNPCSHAVAQEMEQLPMLVGGIDRLAAGETYSGIFADAAKLAAELPDREFIGVVRLSAEYSNTFGDVCTSETVLDLSLLDDGSFKEEAENRPRKMLLY